MLSAVDKLLKFFPLVKVDEAAHMVWGVVTSEQPDSDGEICDYPFAKAQIQKWSDEAFQKTTAAGQDVSLGNMRVMHQLEIGGKATKITFDDEAKKVWVGSTPANDDVWNLLKGGFLTAHSIGGSYAWKRQEGEHVRFGPTIGEISYVDKGANPDASFSYVKADGSIELRKFAKPGAAELELLAKLEKPTVTITLEDLRSELNTGLENLRAAMAKFVVQTSPITGAAEMKMTAEQLKKAAEALGMKPEEFSKLCAETVVDPEALTKAKGGIAALHAHLQKAMEHHDGMCKAHEALASMHEKHSAHLEKCMKACGAVMGSDEKEAEKAIKALIDELKIPQPEPKKEENNSPAVFGKAEVEALLKKQAEDNQKAIDEAVKKALDTTPADSRPASLFKVSRENEVKKADEIAQNDPIPV